MEFALSGSCVKVDMVDFRKMMADLQYALFRQGPAASNLIEGGAFWWADKAAINPDIQYFMVVGAGIEEGVDAVPGVMVAP